MQLINKTIVKVFKKINLPVTHVSIHSSWRKLLTGSCCAISFIVQEMTPHGRRILCSLGEIKSILSETVMNLVTLKPSGGMDIYRCDTHIILIRLPPCSLPHLSLSLSSLSLSSLSFMAECATVFRLWFP